MILHSEQKAYGSMVERVFQLISPATEATEGSYVNRYPARHTATRDSHAVDG
jgi:hypothetical protein